MTNKYLRVTKLKHFCLHLACATLLSKFACITRSIRVLNTNEIYFLNLPIIMGNMLSISSVWSNLNYWHTDQLQICHTFLQYIHLFSSRSSRTASRICKRIMEKLDNKTSQFWISYF